MSLCIYWMQQAQRIRENEAFTAAISYAEQERLPLLVYFGLDLSYPDANERHFFFMLEGLGEVKNELEKYKIPFYIVFSNPVEGIDGFLEVASALFMDRGYLRHQRIWRKAMRQKAEQYRIKQIYEIETDLIVPIEEASSKEEYMARTIRSKLQNKLAAALAMDRKVDPVKFRIPDFPGSTKDRIEHSLRSKNLRFLKEELSSKERLSEFVSSLAIDHTVKPSSYFHGGYTQAKKRLDDFISSKLEHYDLSGSPEFEYNSGLSPYLHFGQICAKEIYRSVIEAFHESNLKAESVQGFLEQLLVRRELAFNYVYYRSGYDCYESMTNPWAYLTMKEHEADPREYRYTLEELEQAKTHDIYWNAAMREAILTGFMHNYMRMYWCKKIIEWSSSYREAYYSAVYLNNRYFLDGRDANTYTGIAWCFGLHDRGWTERSIFGKLRYMNEKGLLRKFNMNEYIRRIDQLKE